MNRGQSRRNIFLEDYGRQSFLDLLADIVQLWKVEIFAYCLMDNHYHLLLSSPAGVLSRPMRHLDGIYTRRPACWDGTRGERDAQEQRRHSGEGDHVVGPDTEQQRG